MTNVAQQITVLINALKTNAPISLSIILILWIIHFTNWLLGYRLNYLGLVPRRLFGIPGILFFSFLHGDFNHLFFNTIPLFILSSFLLTFGVYSALMITIWIILTAGMTIWLLGRPAIHIGASSLIMGYFGFMLAQAYFQVSVNTIVIAFVCIYYLGGLFFSIFPGEEKVSWEGHLFGMLAGVAVSLVAHLHWLPISTLI